MFWGLPLQLYYAARSQAALLAWEWLIAHRYNDLGYCVERLGQLPYVIITQSPASISGRGPYRNTTQP